MSKTKQKNEKNSLSFEFSRPVVITNNQGISNDKVEYDEAIIFSDGSYLVSFHGQECCEHVYADFSIFSPTVFKTVIFDKIIIEKVLDKGIRIGLFDIKFQGYQWAFVPCYDEQTGCYSNDLTIRIYDANNKLLKKFDITDCTKFC